MASPQASQLIAAVLESPRGLLALGALAATFIVLVYLYLNNNKTNKRSPTAKRAPNKRSATTSSTSTSQQAASAKTVKNATPKKTAPSPTAAAKKQQAAANKSASSKSAEQQNKNNSKKAKEPLRQTTNSKVAPAKQRSTKVSESAGSLKDDGEWITVAAKKKTKSPKKAADEASQKPLAGGKTSSATDGRSSLRRSARVQN